MTRGGVRAGCIEALFCLGDKPEIAYRAYREWLAQRGLRTTAEYLVQACEVAFGLGMLPHTNAGILPASEMERLRSVNASLGLMLEIDEPAPARARRRALLGARQGPRGAPPHARGGRRDRHPLHERDPARHRREQRRARRYAARDPRARRSLRSHPGSASSSRSIPKPDTPMRDVRRSATRDVAGWVAMARLVLGSRDERAGAAEPRAGRARAAAALGPQRLGRRLAADGRLHQSRGALADAARAARAAPRRPGSAWSNGCPSTPSTCSAGPSSSSRACARLRSRSVDAAGWVRARRPHRGGGSMTLDRLLADATPELARILDAALGGRELGDRGCGAAAAARKARTSSR